MAASSLKPKISRKASPWSCLPGASFSAALPEIPPSSAKQIHLDTVPTTVIGVLPSWFTYPDARIQFWMPYAQTFAQEDYGIHAGHQSEVVARLKPDVSVEAATHEVSALQYQIHLANASKPVAEDVWSRPMIDDLVKNVRTQLLVLLCAVGCMLLIACLNVSNLLVARAASRRKEVAIRGALGGSRLALIREQMTESLLICLAGGGLGLLLSLASTRWLAAHWRNLPRADAVHVDGWVFAFALGLVVATATPGRPGSGDLFHRQRSCSPRCGSLHDHWRQRLASTAAQDDADRGDRAHGHAAGLGRPAFPQLLRLRMADLGCRIDHVMTMKFGLPEIQYDTRDKVMLFHQSLLERVRRLPGVRGAALVSAAPGSGPKRRSSLHDPGKAGTQLQPSVRCHDPYRGPAVLQRHADSAAARPGLYGT
jgi:hypothetical protein